jgi:hypothetical protein
LRELQVTEPAHGEPAPAKMSGDVIATEAELPMGCLASRLLFDRPPPWT